MENLAVRGEPILLMLPVVPCYALALAAVERGFVAFGVRGSVNTGSVNAAFAVVFAGLRSLCLRSAFGAAAKALTIHKV